MSRPIYVPIADSFFESSIMREELPVRFVMLALIRLGLRPGSNGVIDVDLQIFAQSINLPVVTVEGAIKRLMEPDPGSSSPDEDGKRIVPVNPDRPFRCWRLVNWPKYRLLVNRANDAARKREERHTGKNIAPASASVQNHPESAGKALRDDMRRDEMIRKEPPLILEREIPEADMVSISSKLFAQESE